MVIFPVNWSTGVLVLAAFPVTVAANVFLRVIGMLRETDGADRRGWSDGERGEGDSRLPANVIDPRSLL